jgi:hypothetical protein
MKDETTNIDKEFQRTKKHRPYLKTVLADWIANIPMMLGGKSKKQQELR